MFCKNCGKELPEGAKFCTECGAPVTLEGHEKQTEQEKQDESVEAPVVSSSKETPSKNKFKRGLILAIIIVVALIVVIVVAVRVHSNNVGDEYANDTSAVRANDTVADLENEIMGKYSEEIENEKDALAANVTITDVEVSSTFVLDSGAEYVEYVVSMVVSNDNDCSCDISPSMKATVKVADNYGEEQEEEITFSRANSPYSRSYYGDNEGYLPPVGLAPHETKTVCYYINPSFTDTTGLITLNPNYVQMIDVEMLDFTVEKAPCEYLAVNEWGSTLSYRNVEGYNENFGNPHYMDRYVEVYVTGTIQNNTGEKWESATVQVSSYYDEKYYGGDKSRSFDYINIDETINLDTGSPSFSYYEDEPRQTTTIIPALFWYVPDEE